MKPVSVEHCKMGGEKKAIEICVREPQTDHAPACTADNE